MADAIRWTVKVSRETDTAVRSYLAERGGRKGDLSKFIECAVQKEVLRATVLDIQERNADLSEEELEALVDEACRTVRYSAALAEAEQWRRSAPMRASASDSVRSKRQT